MKREEGLTLKDVAVLLDGVEVPDGLAGRLAPFLREDSRLKDEIAELELMAQDAGIGQDRPERFTSAYYNDQDFRKLLTAQEWERPEDVLDADKGFDVDELLSIAKARLRRSPNALLAEVKERLELAQAKKQAAKKLVDGFLDGLLRLPVKQAEALIAEADRGYRERRASS